VTMLPNEGRPVVTLEQIVETAHAAGPASDPTPNAFAGNLEVLIESVNNEGRLSARGAAAVTWMLGDALRKRIDVTSWWTKEPGIQAGTIEQPIFLTGLPRTGTTYFQYLFDREPTMRMLRTWEGDDPCPPPAVDPASAAERRARSVEAHRQRRQEDGGAMDAFHLSDPDGPQECVMLIDQTFANAGNYWTLRAPTYFNSVAETFDLRASYEHHKRALQVLQWQAPPARWALKWPCHLLALDEILQVYPDALFVVTHRDPVQALASNCSFSAYLRRKFSDDVDLHEVGQHMKDMVGRHIRGLVDFDVARAPGVTIAHVDYARVVADPQAVMKEVYETLGLELTASVRESIAAWRDQNPPGKRGVHTYDLNDYGLNVDEVAEEYAFYTDRFGIPREARQA
jgi:Sulfotransferase family